MHPGARRRRPRLGAAPSPPGGAAGGEHGRVPADPNLFEILSWDYWRLNHGVELPADALAHRDAYLALPAGRTHVLAVVGTKLRAAGRSAAEVEAMPEEHHQFLRFTADAARELYAAHPAVAYVSVFQNWLKPAGASFDHLHKQLVAIDERGAQNEAALARLAAEPNVFNDVAVNAALDAGLVIAANDHAVMFAGFGHRYPTVEVWSRSAVSDPWALPEAELRGMSDLLHAAHAATGADVPCNEEWHTRPAGVERAVPWRVMLKWRVSTLAGFESATKINVNTISPWGVRDRVLARLRELQAAGALADGIRIGADARARPGMLRYAD